MVQISRMQSEMVAGVVQVTYCVYTSLLFSFFQVHRNIRHCMFQCSNMMFTLLVLLLDLKVLQSSYLSRLIEPRAVVFECGPNCKCGGTCVNRTSQRGLKYRLEVI